MEKVVVVPSDRKRFCKRTGLMIALAAASVPVFAQTGPSLTVDYADFGDNVLEQVQTMLTAIIPVAAVLFGAMKGISWLRSML